MGADQLAIAQDGDRVSNFLQFFETMRNIDDSNTTGTQLPDDVEQALHVRIGQC